MRLIALALAAAFVGASAPAVVAAAAREAKAPARPDAGHASKAAGKAQGKARGARAGGQVIRPARVAAAPLAAAIETSLQAGCLDETRAASLATQLALDPPSLETLRIRTSTPLPASTSECRLFAAALGGEEGAGSLALLESSASLAGRRAHFISRSGPQDPLQAQFLDLPYPGLEHRDIRLPAQDLEAMPPQDLAQIPPHLRWEIGHMVRRMVSGLGGAGGHELRMVFDREGGADLEVLSAMELIESATGRVIDGVIWLSRQGEPGTYIGLAGIDHERLLWQSPVRYERISRGVGPSSTTLKRRVAAKPAKGGKQTKTTVRTYQYRGQHIGVDFAGPVGTPIHSVAPGEVVFAGTRGRYGKLVIIDHGTEHQTYYAHLSGFAPGLEAGRKVLRGEEIGYLGSTGFSTGPHLHFEVRKEGQYVDPFEAMGRLDFWDLKPTEHARLLGQWLALHLTRQAPARMAAAGSILTRPASGAGIVAP